MTNIKEEQTIWREYPEYQFIEANQFGQVRIKDRVATRKDGKKYRIKGRILKQQSNGHGYMFVQFNLDGKHIQIYVHRICATCFIPNPNNLPEINHIDCDPTNNAASNLEWCTHQYNNDYREKYGKARNRSIVAVNIKTFEVLHFESRSEAARQLGVHVENICAVLKGRQKITGDYWFTEDESEITKEKIREIRNGIYFWGGIIAVNLKTLEVLQFKSQKEVAKQLEVNHCNVNNVIRGRQNKTHGYWFCYADEHAVEKVRLKFGDDVANKVEELM